MDFTDYNSILNDVEFHQFLDFDFGEHNSSFLIAGEYKVDIPDFTTDQFAAGSLADLASKHEQLEASYLGLQGSNPDRSQAFSSHLAEVAGGRKVKAEQEVGDGPAPDLRLLRRASAVPLIDAPATHASSLQRLSKKRKFADLHHDNFDPALNGVSALGLQSPVPAFHQASQTSENPTQTARAATKLEGSHIHQNGNPATASKARPPLNYVDQQARQPKAASAGNVQQSATIPQVPGQLFKAHLPPSMLSPRPLRATPTRVPWTDTPGTILTKHGHVRAVTANTDLRDAMPYSTELPDCSELGAMEIIAYYPNHFSWPELLLRLLAAGWTTSLIAEYALYARGRLTVAAVTRLNNKIRKATTTAGNTFFKTRRFTMKKHADQMLSSTFQQGPTTYDVTHIQPPAKIQPHMAPGLLSDLSYAVVNHPAGEDRGVLTQVILYDQNKGGQSPGLTTDDVQHIGNRQGFVMPQEARTTRDWDTRARDRALAIIKAQPNYREDVQGGR
ncbi:hypothetical protein EJ03DRAFT_10486 [Teratosphaeria nubilosa]|uniref:Uncharacterized protein n=1 Tax=Teratosphaeria nubilosa TaxID=161662 RepID=A0A6G1LH33_9PEZI|nr:hypothetical protein EJ03DRAFT_10486 [Teratosphaeria nubilosa]